MNNYTLEGEAWISIDEKLPKSGELVLLWHKSQITYALGYYSMQSFHFSHIYLWAYNPDYTNTCLLKDINPQDITHWMPLPERPKLKI